MLGASFASMDGPLTSGSGGFTGSAGTLNTEESTGTAPWNVEVETGGLGGAFVAGVGDVLIRFEGAEKSICAGLFVEVSRALATMRFWGDSGSWVPVGKRAFAVEISVGPVDGWCTTLATFPSR